MNCWRVQNLIAPFLEDELPSAESESLAEHLEECPPCRDVVEGVAALPDFPRIELDADVQASLWSEFDTCLKARIANSLDAPDIPDVAPVGTLHGDLRVPRGLAAAAVAVVVMLAGWNWMTYERLDRLEASLDERDAIILALQERVADSRSDRAFALSQTPNSPLPVLLPANAPGATVIGSTRIPTHYQPTNFQLAGNPSPTLIR